MHVLVVKLCFNGYSAKGQKGTPVWCGVFLLYYASARHDFPVNNSLLRNHVTEHVISRRHHHRGWLLSSQHAKRIKILCEGGYYVKLIRNAHCFAERRKRPKIRFSMRGVSCCYPTIEESCRLMIDVKPCARAL